MSVPPAPAGERVVLVGAGRVAAHLARAFRDAGHAVVLVVSRRREHARVLAAETGAAYAALEERPALPPSEVVVYAVSDDALATVVRRFPPDDRLALHTAGSVDMGVFEGRARHYGVLYPLQTFSHERRVDMREVPLCIEATTPEDEEHLQRLAGSLSRRVYRIDSSRRLHLHVAAVLVSNFVNHLYAEAETWLEKEKIPFDLLDPLIRETTAKALEVGPHRAQTGPAVRNDENVIKKHLELLSCSPGLQELYRLLTDRIRKHHRNT